MKRRLLKFENSQAVAEGNITVKIGGKDPVEIDIGHLKEEDFKKVFAKPNDFELKANKLERKKDVIEGDK